MVDWTVTGSDAGTSDAPKLSFKYLFEEHIFPEPPCWWHLEDISEAICLSFKAKTQAHIFAHFSTTTRRITVQKWARSGNPKLCRCRKWKILMSMFSLQCRSATVLYLSPTPTEWHLQTRFGERASRLGVSWTLPWLLEASSWCTE